MVRYSARCRRRAADIERYLAGILRHGARREQKPCILLRRGRAQIGAHLFDALHRGLHRRRRGAAFAGKRDDCGSVAQRRAIVLAADQIGRRGRRDRCKGRGIDALGSRAVADHGERRGDLGLGDRRRQRVELGVSEVTQVADRSDAVARQHIERISEIGTAVLARVGDVGDLVAQPVERELERRVRHRDLALARAGQEVGDVGIEPDIVTAYAPKPKRAVESCRVSSASMASRIR